MQHFTLQLGPYKNLILLQDISKVIYFNLPNSVCLFYSGVATEKVRNLDFSRSLGMESLVIWLPSFEFSDVFIKVLC